MYPHTHHSITSSVTEWNILRPNMDTESPELLTYTHGLISSLPPANYTRDTMNLIERVNFHCICNGGRCQWGTGLRMVELLGVPSSSCILVELMGSSCYLMCDESSSRAHETNCSIGRLEITHVAGIPTRFWFCVQAKNDFCVVCTCCEVRDVRINGVEAIEHVHRENV